MWISYAFFCGKIEFLCKGRKNDVYDNSKIYENSKYHGILGWNKFKNIKLLTIFVQAIYTNTVNRQILG